MTPAGPSILLVEDSDSDVALLRAVLGESRPDLDLRVAWDGEQALAALLDADRPALPQLVVLDLNLPRVDGLEVLRAVRASEDALVRRLPVIVMTTSRAPADVRRAYELGASAYVPKPFDVDELLEVTRSIAGFWFGAALLPGPS